MRFSQFTFDAVCRSYGQGDGALHGESMAMTAYQEEVASALGDIENKATICRTTCGWKKPELSLDLVKRYWRDVHSPAISRRAGIYEYRHMQFDPVRTDLFPPLDGVAYAAPDNQQLMWLSDVRYRDEAGLQAFGASPGPEEKALLLADIEMIVDKSTTYLVLGENGRTIVDRSGDGAPVGPVKAPTYSLFLRRKSSEADFRAYVRAMCERWAAKPGVIRLRLSLFEVPDMEAERKAGYPIKTHPLEMQYQAWIDISVDNDNVLPSLVPAEDGADCATHIATLHAYPSSVVFTFVYQERPTLIGLRGYAAYDAITKMNATHHEAPVLLKWMYGPVVQEGPAR